jgi:hypothetical protein
MVRTLQIQEMLADGMRAAAKIGKKGLRHIHLAARPKNIRFPPRRQCDAPVGVAEAAQEILPAKIRAPQSRRATGAALLAYMQNTGWGRRIAAKAYDARAV